MKKLLIGFIPLLTLLSCRSAQKTTYTQDQLLPTEQALLWKISGNGAKKSSYLFGTIHLIPKADFRLSEQTARALESCDYIAFEVDMKEMTNLRTQVSLLSKSMMAGGVTLRDLLSEEDYAFVREELEQSGLPLSMVERLKPMFTTTLLGSDEESGMGNANMTSVEMELWRKAKKHKIPSTGLETAAYQLAVFDSIPYDAQARMLVETLRNSDGGQGEFRQMIDMYKRQDINAMQNMIDEEGAGLGDYEELLLNRRNRNWIPVMRDIVRRQPTFFAVGAGHLAGPEGVIALLRSQGFRVEAIQ